MKTPQITKEIPQIMETKTEFPFLLPDDYEEATCQWFDQRQKDYDQPNGISSLPSEEGSPTK